MFKHILIATDGSDGACEALKVAVEMQKIFDADLWILSVFRHHSLREASMSMVRPVDPENMDLMMKHYASDVAERCKRYALEQYCPKVRAFVKSGRPAKTIVRFAEEKGADLIILGHRGLGNTEGFILGSVSHKVSGMARCPVMVV
ncbi:universal stress protein [Gynuella sp.]|uniref:universal stress protein n=1 Tax=Gynuella sp. TaxID=2969146 RepID=UPI003D0A579E